MSVSSLSLSLSISLPVAAHTFLRRSPPTPPSATGLSSGQLVSSNPPSDGAGRESSPMVLPLRRAVSESKQKQRRKSPCLRLSPEDILRFNEARGVGAAVAHLWTKYGRLGAQNDSTPGGRHVAGIACGTTGRCASNPCTTGLEAGQHHGCQPQLLWRR